MPGEPSTEGLTEDELATLLASSEARPGESGTEHAARAKRELEEAFAVAEARRVESANAETTDEVTE